MKLKFHRILMVLCVLCGAYCHAHAQATSEIVEVTTPGTLQQILDDLESSRFESLTIKGRLDAEDIKFLNSGQLAMIGTLDLSEVVLVPGSAPYNTLNVGAVPGGVMGYVWNTYYIADEYKIISESDGANALGGYNITNSIYCNDLSGAFTSANIDKVILPKQLPKIGEYIFSGNQSIKEIVAPEAAKVIGKKAFRECLSLERVELPTNLLSIGEEAFYYSGIKSLSLPESTTNIGNKAFSGSQLTTINLENVKTIGSGAFQNATNLKSAINLSKLDSIQPFTFCSTDIISLELSKNLKYIGEYAFACLTSPAIEKIDFPEGLESIGEGAFESCTYLKEVSIPSSIRHIGARAFYDTPWSETLTSDNGIIYIKNIAYGFDNNYRDYGETISLREGTISISDGFVFPTEVKENVKTLNLPESLIEIGDKAFYGFSQLGEVTLPSSLQRIGQCAFMECPKFWCTLPESLISLEYKAFYGCQTLTKATLPENLRYIGGEVFANSAVSVIRVESKDLDYHLLDWEYESTPIVNETTLLKKIIISSNVTRLYDNIFKGVRSSLSIEFEDVEHSKLTYIGESALKNSGEINRVPSSLKHIGKLAFGSLHINSELNLQNVEYLGEEAFAYCTGITSVVIPELIDTIGGAVFSECEDLNYVEFNAKKVTLLPYGRSYAGSGGSTSNAGYIFENCRSLKEAKIGAKVTSIPDRIFCGCINLSNIEFQSISSASDDMDRLKLTIGEGAFLDCRALLSVNLPEETDSIKEQAFKFTGLTTITIPTSCKMLGAYIFDMTPLTSIYFTSMTPPIFEGPLDDRSWDYAQEITVYVPAEAYDIYRSEPELLKYKMECMPSTSVKDIISPISPMRIISVHDLNGLPATEKWFNGSPGYYIIRMSDGSIHKVLR